MDREWNWVTNVNENDRKEVVANLRRKHGAANVTVGVPRDGKDNSVQRPEWATKWNMSGIYVRNSA